MRFNPLFAAIAGMFMIAAVPILVNGSENGGRTSSEAQQSYQIAQARQAGAIGRNAANNQARPSFSQPNQPKNAQEYDASLTNWMQGLSAVAVALFTYFLWRLQSQQVGLTGKALREAADATDAMKRQNEIAEDAAKRQLRAYVTTEDHEILGFWRGGPTTLRTKIYNRGQSPAYDLKIWSIVGGTLEEPDDFKVKQIKKGNFRQSSAMLGPGQWLLHGNSCQAPLNGDAYVGIVGGGLKLIFAGVVSYRDIFGRRYFTIFKQFYTGRGDWAEQSSDLLACGRHNNGN
jgi:hypothetical protein